MKRLLLLLLLLFLYGLTLLSGCGGGSLASFPPLTISTASLPNGTFDLTYSRMIQASGGVAPFTWTVSAGTLPHNLALSSTATRHTGYCGAGSGIHHQSHRFCQSISHTVLHRFGLVGARQPYFRTRKLNFWLSVGRNRHRRADGDAVMCIQSQAVIKKS